MTDNDPAGLIRLFQHAFHVSLPTYCLLCNTRLHTQLPLCTSCQDELPRLQSACKQCAYPLPHNTNAVKCGLCLNKPSPIDRTHASFRYHTPISELITQFKFHGNLAAGQTLGFLMANILKHAIQQKPQLLIPVPLHRRRLRSRGFNQAIELAKPVSRRLNIPIDRTACQKLRHTQAQSELPAKVRIQNLKNAFQLTRAISASHVAIIDDIYTTGATTQTLAHTLKKHGVTTIEAWCLARAE